MLGEVRSELPLLNGVVEVPIERTGVAGVRLKFAN